MFHSLLATAEASTAGCLDVSSWQLWVILGAVILVFFGLQFFSRRKQREQANQIMNGLKPGARVKTIGGIVGEIVEIRAVSATEKHIVIRTGAEGSETTLTMDINAIGMVLKDTAPVDPDEPVMPTDDEVKRLVNGTESESAGTDGPADGAESAEPAAPAQEDTAYKLPDDFSDNKDDGKAPFKSN
ncbi:MAG: preprotein translocase subunit YajC [Clostridiales bacterium]|jgi:preprotein translocase YajC subunit|nr:preprotein translocase subunit YajC [Clostridiales bacterium]